MGRLDPDLDAAEPGERIRGLGEGAPEHDPADVFDVLIEPVPIRIDQDLAAGKVEVGLLLQPDHVVDPGPLGGVGGQNARLVEAAVDITREDQAPVAEEVAQHHRGATVDAVPEVVPGVAEGRRRHVVGGELDPIAPLSELGGVGERDGVVGEHLRHRHRGADTRVRGGSDRRGAEAALSAIEAAAGGGCRIGGGRVGPA